ncbi:hypothetical protein [Streptomyces griseocarneus]|uniref:hypothetical protein n=1 Tax=Streptomyces griseocarneus TaxID=51201 RepID=UPI00167D420F|nr:hypothetical protein [Streptomyces griseocarneus]MBZ6476748.1 hypothetical protein [Streptomyces griseocarneus]GHG80697.1 hypothetical protein GCM10018779_62480 [Streptomyces griseocarneus]
MRTLPFDSETLHLTDRPIDPDFPPLPHGLTLDQAVAVHAHEVKAGDLVLAVFSDESGTRRAEHVPTPYRADPHALRDCPCEGCEECDDIDRWTLADHGRVADVGWRFVCLAPSERGESGEDDEPCAIELRNRPVAVILADVVAAVEEATRAPVRTYGVMWSADFEASSPQEAAQLAYEQLKSYATDGWPPEMEVTDEAGYMAVIDLNATQQAEGSR